MNRQATALGRRAFLSSRAWASQPTPATFFSTTSTAQAESSSDGDNGNSKPNGRERSQVAASQLAKLRADHGPPSPVDARALGSAVRRVAIDPSKLVTMRSIRVRGGLGGRGGFAGRGGRGGMFVNREGARVSAEDAAAGEGRFIKIENGRIWGPGRGAALAAGMGRGLRGRGRGGERKQDGDGKRRRRRGNEHEAKKEKMVLTPEEQKVMNDVEQGVVTDYAPKLTAKEILGYGPAVASDTAMAKIESAMEAMRMLGGARAFNSDAGVTGDTRETVKRYFHEKKPVFFNTPEEKAWMESSRPGWKIHGPQDATKKAILDSVVLGKYEKPGFAEARDTIPMIVNYHSSSTSYKTSDSAKFIKKLQELLPVDTTATAAPKEKTV